MFVLGYHEPLTWYWFLAVPVLLLQTLFNVGAALIISRIGAELNDVSQLVPFLTRVWRYFCGVMYSIATPARHAAAVGEGDPAAQPGRRVHLADAALGDDDASGPTRPAPSRTTP